MNIEGRGRGGQSALLDRGGQIFFHTRHVTTAPSSFPPSVTSSGAHRGEKVTCIEDTQEGPEGWEGEAMPPVFPFCGGRREG